MSLNRRGFIIVTGSTLSSALIAACDSRGPKGAQRLLRYAERKNEAIERALVALEEHHSTKRPAAPDRQRTFFES